jgi:glycosyltransferase involved in cell wall biosynthesis
MAMRKPVIATAVGGIPEVVIPGVTGYLHEHGNSQELADAINLLIEDPELSNHIGMTAHKHVQKNYSREKFASDIAKAYSDLMQG